MPPPHVVPRVAAFCAVLFVSASALLAVLHLDAAEHPSNRHVSVTTTYRNLLRPLSSFFATVTDTPVHVSADTHSDTEADATPEPQLQEEPEEEEEEEEEHSPFGLGFAEYDGTYDASRLRPRVLRITTSKLKTTVLPKYETVPVRSVHSARGFFDFALTLKQRIAQPGGWLPFASNVRLHFSTVDEVSGRDVFGRVSVVVRVAEQRLSAAHTRVVPAALRAIMQWPAPRVFATYGTHVVTGIVHGGELSLWGAVKKGDEQSERESEKEKEKDKKVYDECFDAAFDAYVAGFSALPAERAAKAERVDTAGLTTVGGDPLNDTVASWAHSISYSTPPSDSPSDPGASANAKAQPVAFTPGGAVALWELLHSLAASSSPSSSEGYSAAALRARANALRAYYGRAVSPGAPLILKRFDGAWSAASGTPTASAGVPADSGWKIVSGGVETRYEVYGQLVTRSFPRVAGWRDTADGAAVDADAESVSVDDAASVRWSASDAGADGNSSTYGEYAGPITSWDAQSKDHLHIDAGAVRAFAVALWDPADRYEVRVAVRRSARGRRPRAGVRVAAGFALVGGGAYVHWAQQPGCLLVGSHAHKGGWAARASDHLVASEASVSAFAVGVRRRDSGAGDAGVRSTVQWATTAQAGRVTVAAVDAPADEPWRYTAAGGNVATPGSSSSGNGRGAGTGSDEKQAFLTTANTSPSGLSAQTSAQEYINRFAHRLSVTGVKVFGGVYVTDADSVRHIAGDADAL